MDTCGSVGSVAFADGTRVIAQVEIAGRRFAEELVPAVERVLAGVTMAELDAIGVVRGPGSFTGVRIGLSAAKGLSDASGVGVVAVSRLAVMAALADRNVVHAVMDGGRGEFYYGHYVGGECLREALVTADELRAAVSGGEIVICEEKLVGTLDGARLIAEPRARDAVALLLERVERGAFEDLGALDGNYLRRTESIYAKPGGA